MTDKTLEELASELEGMETEKPNVEHKPIRRVRRRYVKILAAVATVFVAGIVLGALLVGTQNFPLVPPPPITMKLGCSTLTASQANVTPGSNGKMAFTCGTFPAFNVTKTGGFTPAFTLPSGYTNATVIPPGTSLAISCATSTNHISITNGVLVSIGFGSWFYCIDWVNASASGLGAFSVTWSQG